MPGLIYLLFPFVPICTHLCLLAISYVILPWFMNLVYDLITAWLQFSLFLFVVFLCIYILISLDVYPNVNRIPFNHVFILGAP